MSAGAEEPGKIGRFRDDGSRRRFMAAYDAALQRWPIPPSQVDVETRFGSTHVLASGSTNGTPIVLLHGMAVSSPSWFADIGPLGERHPIYAIDTITDAGRGTQTSRIRSGLELSHWLDDVLAALDLDAAHLVGLSYGGWLALNQARHAPQRLASLTAVDPIGAIGRPKTTFLIKIVPDSILALAKSEEAIHRLIRRLNNGTMPDQIVLELSVAGLRTFIAKQPAPKRMTDEDLRTITTPALLIFCDESPVNHSQRAAERSRRCVPNAETLVVANAGHMLPIERPELFTKTVLAFIDRVDALPRT